MEGQGIAEFFVIAGIPESGRKIDTESRPLRRLDPITDITVINRSNDEPIPAGYKCIEFTPGGYQADLNHGSFRSSSMHLCYKRGRDKPPLIDIGVIYYDGKEKLARNCSMVMKTPSGFSANVNNSGTQTYFTYRRSEENAPCNQLVVTDICVILQNKGEQPPHAFCLIDKNLNKGFLGSNVFVCYKKSVDRPPYIPYFAEIIDRFSFRSLQYSFPSHVELFCLPMGATIECLSSKALIPWPSFLTFVLTTADSEKLYGSTLNFYETISPEELTADELKQLGYIEASLEVDTDEWREAMAEAKIRKSLQRVKSIGILSRWPFFDQFKRFLSFLHRLYIVSAKKPLSTSLESYIFYFLKDIHFPLPERPDILVTLYGETGEESLTFSQSFDDLPLPSNGASFKKMLINLGPENCLSLLLFTLTEQKILLHSLRPSILTEIAEAMITMIFPFYWHCPYIPMCPIMMNIGNQKFSMSDFLGAPMPYIVGIDSRYFDHNIEPPFDVASIDIDTRSIYMCETKRNLNLGMLPKKEKDTLLATLRTIYDRIRSSEKIADKDAKRLADRQIETEIQEAFLYFMAQILKDFRQYLKPITAAPRVGATDASSLFDIEGFLQSRPASYQPFYDALLRTQMFTRFIEERSLVSDKNVSLAFFDECIEKVEKHHKKKVALIEYEDKVKSNKTVFIAIPDSPAKVEETFSYSKFGPFDQSLFLRMQKEYARGDSLVMTDTSSNQSLAELIHSELNCYSYAKRAKHEIRKSQRFATQAARSPIQWAKHLLYKSYCLWFTHFPAYSHQLRQVIKGGGGRSRNGSIDSKKIRPLSIAYEVLERMQSMKFAYTDEFCYRILMILCTIHNQPALAVKVFLNMRRYRVKLNAITYGYYNKAVLEGNWPTEARLNRWAKVRNVFKLVWHFKQYIQPIVETAETLSLPGDSLPKSVNFNEEAVDGGSKSEKASPVIDHLDSIGILMLSGKNLPQSASKEQEDKKTPDTLRRHSSLQEFCVNLPNQTKVKNGHIKRKDPAKDSPSGDNGSNKSEDGENDHSFARFTTPLKEAFNNAEIFSPKFFGSTIRSSFKLAKNFTKSSKYGDEPATITRDGKVFNKNDSLPRVVEGKLSTTTTTTPMVTPVKPIHRSSTLPQTLNQMKQQQYTPDSKAQRATLGTSSGQQTPVNSSFSSPWANKLSDIKHSEYVLSTFKMAANRWNELKFSLASVNTPSSTNTPVKLSMNMSNMMDKGSLLLSQLKNYAFDEVDGDKNYGNNNHFDMFEEFDETTFDIEDYRELFDKVNSYYSKPLESSMSMKQEQQQQQPEEAADKIIFRVSMISSIICNHCKANIFDEDIMAKWTADDSNLNTACPFCATAIVPTLKIMIRDYRCSTSINGEDGEPGQDYQQLDALSVVYLSPLVLHKELESVLHSEGYGCLVEASFVDKHPIVYWNLVWYFHRLNLPSHLPGLALYASTLYGNQSVPPSPDKSCPYDQRNVSIVCLWESEKFYDVVPSYKKWHRTKSIQEKDEPETDDAEEVSRNSQKIYQEMIGLIKSRDLMKPIQFMISMRKATAHSSGIEIRNRYCNSIYRELLFLALSQLGPEGLNIDTFDADYKTAFQSLPAKERSVTNKVDNPLAIGAIFCRNLFQQLSLEVTITDR